VDLASTVKSENLKSDFSVALRYICLPCGTKDGVQNSSGAKAYKYTTTKFALLTQHHKDYHADRDFQYCRTLRVTCLVCNLRLSLKKFREHVQATHPKCLASIICVHICLLCNDHCNYREKMLSHLLETHSKKEADNFDTNVISRKLCLFCGANGNLGDPQMEDHQCTSIVVDDVAQFIDLTEAGSPPGKLKHFFH
jgi:hypothetical protein